MWEELHSQEMDVHTDKTDAIKICCLLWHIKNEIMSYGPLHKTILQIQDIRKLTERKHYNIQVWN